MREFIVVFVLTVWAPAAALSENWIRNGDFEQPASGWTGAVVQGEVTHRGKGALRLDRPGDDAADASARHEGVAVNQNEPAAIQASCWLRVDATRQSGPFRGGLTFFVELADGASLYWYSGFQADAAEAGSWVYREARWKPWAPVVRVRPLAYLRGCEGSLYVDDLYLGPPVDGPPVPRQKIPLAVTGSAGRFTHWPRFRFLDFRSTAHVFHLDAEGQTSLALTAEVEVLRAAPAYLTSA
ncbi:MAG: hypothetical protein QHJ73_04525, partial [Armatimonadota bacterium]|nr:hypothetical protein [Armatimonadota bacterium]